MEWHNEEGSVVIEAIAMIFKLLIISVIFFQISIYVITVTKFNIVSRDVLQRASIEGYIDSGYLRQRLIDLNIDTDRVVVLKSKPKMDELCINLGDEMMLEVSMSYPVKFGGLWMHTVEIESKKKGVNQGYYGKGYVDRRY